MKYSIIGLLFFINTSIFAQKNEVEQNALKWFKSVYVESSFKDPYSFKLMKISSKSESYYEYLVKEHILPFLDLVGLPISTFNNLDTNYLNTNIELYTNMLDKKVDTDKNQMKLAYLNILKNEFKNILKFKKESLSKKINKYHISIDCYSKNGFGLMILGKFRFDYYPKESYRFSTDEFLKYDKYSIDLNSLIDLNK